MNISVNSFNLVKTLSAFTRDLKGKEGEVVRPAIPKFDFSVSLNFDLTGEERQAKWNSIVSELVTQTIKNDIQAKDREEAWGAESISSKFTECFNSYTLDSLYSLVCLNSNGRFGLKSFMLFVENVLLPNMEDSLSSEGKTLNDKSKKIILGIAKQGNRMPANSLTTMLSWIEKYASDTEQLAEVLEYLTTQSKVESIGLDGLGI